MPKITETPRSDISTVYGYLTEPTERTGNGQLKMSDYWSCFGNDYPLGYERSFIAEVERNNPGRYSSYHISWTDCN
jgi:hypothetical protein